MALGPDQGTVEYVAQVEQVMRFLKNADAKTKAQEDQVMLMFVMDRAYSRSAIMEAIGRHRQNLDEAD